MFCVDDIVNVTLLKGGMIDNSTSILANNTISLTNVFDLLEDQNYTVNVSYEYIEETNMIHNSTEFGMFNLMFNPIVYFVFFQTLMECSHLMSLILVKTLYI